MKFCQLLLILLLPVCLWAQTPTDTIDLNTIGTEVIVGDTTDDTNGYVKEEIETIDTKVELNSVEDKGDNLPPPPPPPPPSTKVYDATTNNWLLYNPIDTGKIYSYGDQIPEFPGGNSAMINYIIENLNYPQSDTRGTVFVYFIVEKDGSLSNLKVSGSVDGVDNKLFDTEALRIVSRMPKWTPGKYKGKAVRMEYNLPIRFR